MEIFFANGILISTDAETGSAEAGNEETGSAHKCISMHDRALQYGDGVFETLRIVDGKIPMWKYHQQRLKNAQQILDLPLDDFFAQWQSFISEHLGNVKSACAKLVISRGEGPRGYKIPQQVSLNWWLLVTDLPVRETKNEFKLTLCRHALSRQPRLAGLKHLNRLDQVLARSEWSEQDDFDEGIMFNLDGDVIEGTMSNIFWLKSGQLFTPDLSQEGIDGCVRRWVIDQYAQNSNAVAKAEPKAVTKAVIIEKDAKLDQLLTADAVFLTNSLMGIQPVSQIDGQTIEQNKAIETLSTEFNRQFIQH